MGNSRRVELGNILRAILGSDNIYFQPGPDVTMSFPAITYERDNIYRQSADNALYTWMQRYQVTLIDNDPDNDAFEQLLQLQYCTFDRHFSTSDLNHDVFVIYH